MTDETSLQPTPSGAMRAGPRPLAFHLASALAALGGAVIAPPTTDRLQSMLTGIEAYRAHPYRRDVEDPPVIWSQGSTRLLDYGALTAAGGTGETVLFTPSLVNRSYVLDLSSRRSMMRWMAAEGFRPLLVDWGSPGELEAGYSLDDYVIGRLEKILDLAVSQAAGPVPIVGYCMGGNLSLALAQRRQSDVSSLTLMATPWDFHAGSGVQAELFAAVADSLEAVIAGFGQLPVDILQTFFASLDPALGLRKFCSFAELDAASVKAAEFVALEDWLNDGVPLTAAVARECLIKWYGDNAPAKGTWLIGGAPVDPTAIDLATLVAAPAQDRIVPPDSARPLAELIPNARLIMPPSGHIGMAVGSKAEAGMWRPLADWLRAERV
jgi:polyhydroxyalkanoate synthase